MSSTAVKETRSDAWGERKERDYENRHGMAKSVEQRRKMTGEGKKVSAALFWSTGKTGQI